MMHLIKYGLLMAFLNAAVSLEPKQQEHTTHLTCFHSTDSKAPDATKLFPENEDNGSLWQRDQDMSLPRCSSSTFQPFSASKCNACLKDQELFVICSNLQPKENVVLECPESEIRLNKTDCVKVPFNVTPKPPDPSDISSFVTKNDTTSKPELNSRQHIFLLIPLSIGLITIIIIRVRRKPQEIQSQINKQQTFV